MQSQMADVIYTRLYTKQVLCWVTSDDTDVRTHTGIYYNYVQDSGLFVLVTCVDPGRWRAPTPAPRMTAAPSTSRHHTPPAHSPSPPPLVAHIQGHLRRSLPPQCRAWSSFQPTGPPEVWAELASWTRPLGASPRMVEGAWEVAL